jgi:hypothetical protein
MLVLPIELESDDLDVCALFVLSCAWASVPVFILVCFRSSVLS